MIPSFNNMTVPPTVIYTKLENHFGDIGNRLKERDDYDDLKPPQKEVLKLQRANEVLHDFTQDIKDHLKKSMLDKFFIFNPTLRFYAYKFGEFAPGKFVDLVKVQGANAAYTEYNRVTDLERAVDKIKEITDR